jgi:uncharacterized membrane protein
MKHSTVPNSSVRSAGTPYSVVNASTRTCAAPDRCRQTQVLVGIGSGLGAYSASWVCPGFWVHCRGRSQTNGHKLSILVTCQL